MEFQCFQLTNGDSYQVFTTQNSVCSLKKCQPLSVSHILGTLGSMIYSQSHFTQTNYKSQLSLLASYEVVNDRCKLESQLRLLTAPRSLLDSIWLMSGCWGEFPLWTQLYKAYGGFIILLLSLYCIIISYQDSVVLEDEESIWYICIRRNIALSMYVM